MNRDPFEKFNEVRQWAATHGWQEDRWQHWRKGEYRLRISTHAVRYEVKSGAGWVRLRSAYLRDITITPDGKLAGLTRAGCQGFPDRKDQVTV